MFGILHTLLVLAVLIILNEIFRRYKALTLVFFIAVPLILTFAVWIPNTTGDSSTNTWFHWAKVYSVVIAAIGFTLMRMTKMNDLVVMKLFVPAILVINIIEAVVRDFEFYASTLNVWHVLNGVAGIFCLLAISGWKGISSEKDDKQDLLWTDMTVYWIIAYSIWNLSYVWFCIPIHSGYAFTHLLAAFIPAFFIKKGTWIQARAYTLAAWMIYLFTFTSFIDNPQNLFQMPENSTIKLIFGILSITSNGAFFAYHVYRKIKLSKWKLGENVHAIES